jgi:hypothetical protein
MLFLSDMFILNILLCFRVLKIITYLPSKQMFINIIVRFFRVYGNMFRPTLFHIQAHVLQKIATLIYFI